MKKVLGLTMGLALAAAGSASAAEFNLATVGATAMINGAIYTQFDPQSTGSGVIDSFVRINPGGNITVEQGYNTTANNVFDTGNTDTFNHELLLSSVPIVAVGGTSYYEFILDLNQNSGGNNEFLTIDEIQIFTSTTENQSVETFTGCRVALADSTLVYSMDGCNNAGTPGTNNTALTNYALNAGSGSGDIQLLVPVANFVGAGQFVYLYSKFGGETYGGVNYGANDGFEEWAVRGVSTPPPPPPVPEPGTMLLLGTGLLAVARGFKRHPSSKA